MISKAEKDAKARGRRRIAELRRLAEPTLTTLAASKALGVTQDELMQLLVQRQLLAIPKGRGLVLPAFQFKGGAILPGLPAVLNALETDSVFTMLSFVLSPNLDLGGKTAVEMMEAGDVEPVLAEARVFLKHGA